MYSKILIPVENTASDRTILTHIRALAKLTGASLTLLHVADGWAARNLLQLDLQDSEEMQEDRAYLAGLEAEVRAEGFTVASVLANGEPATEIIKLSRELGADLIAMATHGHRFIGDLIHGSTADKVRHEVGIPVLLLKVAK